MQIFRVQTLINIRLLLFAQIRSIAMILHFPGYYVTTLIIFYYHRRVLKVEHWIGILTLSLSENCEKQRSANWTRALRWCHVLHSRWCWSVGRSVASSCLQANIILYTHVTDAQRTRRDTKECEGDFAKRRTRIAIPSLIAAPTPPLTATALPLCLLRVLIIKVRLI